MDRFIARQAELIMRSLPYLKSSMDRFIEDCLAVLVIAHTLLKSSMDRFIAEKNKTVRHAIITFKIQYG